MRILKISGPFRVSKYDLLAYLGVPGYASASSRAG